MLWLFGKKDEPAPAAAAAPANLGFDASLVQDINTIILTPGALDSQRLHPLAGLERGVEYLDLEDELLTQLEGAQGIIPLRGWTDDLCYGTGAVYLMGLGVGGAYGFQEGLRNIPEGAPAKLRLNTVLNHVTKRGPFLGNSAGVLALVYNLVDLILDLVRGKHDSANLIGAGVILGALFKSSAGLRPMGISAGLMGVAAASWCGLKTLLV